VETLSHDKLYATMYLAIDIGGTKTLIALFDKDGELKKKVRFPTPSSYSVFVNTLREEYSKIGNANPELCVVGAPGRIDRAHGVGVAFGNLAWDNVPLKADIEAFVGCKVLVENDANLAGLSEAALVLKKYKNTLYITISTGIGGVLIKNGVINAETADMEPGHMLLEHQDKLQRWQEFASGKAIVRKFGLPAKNIVDPGTWYIICRNIAIGLINLVSTLTPDIVIIGGGVGSHFEKFGDRLKEEMQLYANDLIKVPDIIAASRAEDAVLYGCYELAKQHDA